jgi:hypothetical protein
VRLRCGSSTWKIYKRNVARSIKSPAPIEARPETVGLERVVLLSQRVVELVHLTYLQLDLSLYSGLLRHLFYFMGEIGLQEEQRHLEISAFGKRDRLRMM